MSDAQRSTLFQSFSQADTSTTRQYGGTGLGLAICKRLVELMGGTIECTSRLNFGSEFRFVVPFRIHDGRPAERRLAPSLPERMRVLVVDDNRTSRSILQDILEAEGVRVKSCSTCPQALDLLRSNDKEDPYEAVVLDWKMPGMDGAACARIIISEGLLPDPRRIVMLTAYGQEELRKEVDSYGVKVCLAKPISRATLLDAIAQGMGGEDAVRKPEAAEEVGPPLAQRHGAQVLLAEDNKLNQQVAVELLQAVGLDVVVVENGRQAVDMIQTGWFSLVLMDIQMPVMDGIEATRTIREMEKGGEQRVPIIAMTANAMKEDRQKSLDAGMDDHIAKPIDPDVLYDTLRRWLRVKPPADSPVEQASFDFFKEGVPNLDHEMGIKRMAGNASAYLRLLRSFPERHGTSPEDIRRCMLEGEHSTAAAIAHTVAGAAGNLGMTEVHHLAKELQSTLQTDPEKAGAALDAFASALLEMEELLLHLPVHNGDGEAASGREGEAGEEAEPSPEETRRLVEDFLAALEGGSPKARNLWAGLRGALFRKDAAMAERVDMKMKAFDYPAAMAALRQFMEPSDADPKNTSGE
jgi:CheY-like chemotaxis protein